MSAELAVLLSGGIDSSSLAFWLRPSWAIFIDYGQLASREERAAARRIARLSGINFALIRANCRQVGSGMMAGRPPSIHAPAEEWWPFRNQLLATLAAAWAVGHGVQRIAFASVATDGEHADGGMEFFRAINRLSRMQEGRIAIEAPAAKLTTEALVRQSQIPLKWLGWTHSCFAGGMACGTCRGCAKRRGVLEHVQPIN